MPNALTLGPFSRSYRTGKCEYRKCDANCLETSWDFEFEGEAYQRNRECCDSNLCNGVCVRDGGGGVVGTGGEAESAT